MTKKKDPKDCLPPGRESQYDPDIFQEIIDRMSKGEATTAILKDEGMPSWGALMRWMRRDDLPGLREQYAQAREDMIDFWVESAIMHATDRSKDYQKVTEKITGGKGGDILKVKDCSDNTASQRDRLIVDTIFKAAGRMLPHKYSEKIQQEITGKGGKDLSIVVNISGKSNNS